ncbi:diphthine methyl ester synthase [Chelonus insularis]|uniref:diphthine methyl ester synthase n=1 Tax=Chelonus insularis TaxID=460826 RepID=UPI00158AE996|nr:diphthine methyl ester synthase [Chelonus insularis]XP_034944232.1 diphthine methyl ester synthase [Chelonus insularis]XP_034944233.1 diphthine methyl ester synthase [Chelonus insularis]XP_034944234.1 diphthine methyl ester synthase [Chelonus insularis]XP_034944235.1 diphthine methyl ester synthase [Chelonus insularis]
MLYLIGLGLGDASDVTVKGFEIIRKCDKIYLEAYTSILTVGTDALEKFYGRSIELADREFIESGAEDILSNAINKDIALLIVGDPFGATTHTDLVLRARERNVPVQIIHNASILNAVGCCGLQLYSFGEIVSIPYWTDSWKPASFYDKLSENMKRGLHTLCLLDIKIKEPTMESIMKKKKEYMPPKFMSVAEAANQLLSIIKERRNNKQEIVLVEDSLTVGLARVGSNDQQIIACNLRQISSIDLGLPLHSLVIPAPKNRLHPLEIDYLRQFALNKEEFNHLYKNS